MQDVIYQLGGVKETAVVCVPDPYGGKAVKAYVALKEGIENPIVPEDIISFCRTLIAVYKYPGQVEFVSEIPKTITGKFLRRTLLEKSRDSK